MITQLTRMSEGDC